VEASVAPIHLTVEGLGNPLRVRFTAGQRHDSTQAQAPALLDGLTFEQVIADRGSAGAAFSAYLHKRGGAAVIPPQKRAKSKGEYDTWLYRERHLIACCFNTLAAHSPHTRRTLSRFDKRDRSVLGFVQVVCALQRSA